MNAMKPGTVRKEMGQRESDVKMKSGHAARLRKALGLGQKPAGAGAGVTNKCISLLLTHCTRLQSTARIVHMWHSTLIDGGGCHEVERSRGRATEPQRTRRM